jgi:signal transduction histidine kinase
VFLYALIVAAAWFLGDVVRRWRTAAEEHARRAAELAAAREELARYAVSEERLRIARELHDVVAHSMTVVAMHAGTARMIADRDPAATRAALETIERASREALGEMRRVVGVLREGDLDGVSLQPTPGLRDLERLVAEVAMAGVTVGLRTKGSLDRVPPGQALAAYRIAQEALTNVVRHSESAHAELTVTVADTEVAIVVRNDPPGERLQRPVVESGGMGTIGMRERVRLYGGTLKVGPLGDGGFLVEARLPLGMAAS